MVVRVTVSQRELLGLVWARRCLAPLTKMKLLFFIGLLALLPWLTYDAAPLGWCWFLSCHISGHSHHRLWPAVLLLRKVNLHPVDLTTTVGSNGLGLILGKEEEGTRWIVNGFRSMPDGHPNPAEVKLGPSTYDTYVWFRSSC